MKSSTTPHLPYRCQAREAELIALLKECLPLVEGARQAYEWGYMLKGAAEEVAGFAQKSDEIEVLIGKIRAEIGS